MPCSAWRSLRAEGPSTCCLATACYRTATGWTAEGPCIRFHVGLENPDDLKADLEEGFKALKSAS